MSSSDPSHSAATILAARRRAGLQGARLPLSCRPTELEQALMIQAAVTQQLEQAIGGWKCGLPAPGKLVAAPIFAADIHQTSPCPVWDRGGFTKIEPELAFVLGADLPARAAVYTSAEVDAAISATHLALELIDSRYREPGETNFAEALADGLLNQGLYLGPQVDDADGLRSSELAITIRSDDGLVMEFAGAHPTHHPRAPLYWLAEYLRSQGQGLVKGQVVITGSYAGSIAVPLNKTLNVRFGDLGSLDAGFVAR